MKIRRTYVYILNERKVLERNSELIFKIIITYAKRGNKNKFKKILEPEHKAKEQNKTKRIRKQKF